MLKYNPIMDCDSYKLSHFKFYPKNIQEMYSYLESRGGEYPKTFFYGLKPILQKLATKIEPWMIEEVEKFAPLHGEPLNIQGWKDIMNMGYLPLEIKAVKEGTLVDNKNVLLTIRNTDPRFAWLTSYFETMLLRIWYPITVATRIYYMKQKIIPYFEKSGNLDNLPFALLDFSSRGVSSYEQSEIGGGAYLTQFQGSDNVPAVRYMNDLYDVPMTGFSIPATEHSIMCAYDMENEFESFKRIIEETEEGTAVSVVSDTWNIFNACDYWGLLAEEIKRKNITLVVRPDSGEIKDVLPKVLTMISKSFGTTTNDKGYEVINNAKILWGDGINEDSVTEVFDIANYHGISADSVLTGSGGGLMQVDINRDTNKFAIKGSNVIVNGESIPIAKNPITDPGKMSKKGKMKLVNSSLYDSRWKTITTEDYSEETYNNSKDLLETVFYNGEISNLATLEEIRNG